MRLQTSYNFLHTHATVLTQTFYGHVQVILWCTENSGDKSSSYLCERCLCRF